MRNLISPQRHGVTEFYLNLCTEFSVSLWFYDLFNSGSPGEGLADDGVYNECKAWNSTVGDFVYHDPIVKIFNRIWSRKRYNEEIFALSQPSCDNYVKPAAICYNFPPSVTTTSSKNLKKTWNVLKSVITLHQKSEMISLFDILIQRKYKGFILSTLSAYYISLCPD